MGRRGVCGEHAPRFYFGERKFGAIHSQKSYIYGLA